MLLLCRYADIVYFTVWIGETWKFLLGHCELLCIKFSKPWVLCKISKVLLFKLTGGSGQAHLSTDGLHCVKKVQNVFFTYFRYITKFLFSGMLEIELKERDRGAMNFKSTAHAVKLTHWTNDESKVQNKQSKSQCSLYTNLLVLVLLTQIQYSKSKREFT